ncbi:hypothetical protein FHR99_000123 [Litorivivens lipolytica]|uniref:Uncharacterized protein n=1 Tax=Litorivivens lipolytica TaxID=1524264 RepID=A0A7W4Z4B8_9GAMM|nr:hypothetical protein [Litorivivens lipolytica]MBB3045887.1 hypothetical protein [Litorivivens lipolytica]
MPRFIALIPALSLTLWLAACNSTGGSDPVAPLEPIPLASGPTEPCTDCSASEERESPTPAPDEGIRALWVWGSQVVLNTERQDALFAFAKEKSLNSLYLEASEALRYEQAALAAFFQRAEQQAIAVELLFGQPDWALPDNHHHVMSWIDRVADFAERYPELTIAAIHLDVEPYLLPEWDSERQTLASSFVKLLSDARARANGYGYDLWADIPVWYDEHGIFYEGRARPLHELVVDATDGIVLMDYRDETQRIINDARNELSYASSQNRPMVVGVETLCIEPTWITFCEEGSQQMEATLVEVDAALREYRAYSGTAIHHFDSYLTLQR